MEGDARTLDHSVVALTLRLADHLKALLGGERLASVVGERADTGAATGAAISST